MGKKKKKLIDQMWPKFLEGCKSNGHPEDVVKKVWTDWEAFASYAFNKSHSTCYAFVAFQTAYLKAHHPAEFMAAVLNHNKKDIAKINFFLRECKRMRIDVLGPSINESQLNFHVNKKGQIRFGLSAMKGVGEAAVADLVEERKSGEFPTIFDAVRRINLRSVSKKVFEAMALGGALDEFDYERSQYFAPSGKFDTFLEHLIKYGITDQEQRKQNQVSLFAGSDDINLEEPKVPEAKAWSTIEKLEKEKEVTGIYISGHPLDDYRLEIENYVSHSLDKVENTRDTLIKGAGMVTAEFHGVTQKGQGYGRFTVQDYNGALEIALFSEDYLEYKSLFEKGQVLYIEGAMKSRYGQDRYFFKLAKAKLLDTIGQQLTKCITLRVNVNSINDVLIDNLNAICERYEGNHALKMLVVDPEEELTLGLVSSAKKVNVDAFLVNELEGLGLPYKLN